MYRGGVAPERAEFLRSIFQLGVATGGEFCKESFGFDARRQWLGLLTLD